MVGREREIEQVAEALDAALQRDGNVVLVSGEPGIGKSRLLEELVARGKDQGATVLQARCWEAGGAPPYWPWVQALRAYVSGRDPDELRAEIGVHASDLAQMVPDVRRVIGDVPPPPESDPEQARFRMFDSAVSVLRAGSAKHPIVIVIDDLHAADTPSLLFLRFLGQQLQDARLLIAGGYRETELHADHPLSETVAELVREPGTRQIALRGLTQADVVRYVSSVDGVAGHERLAAAIHAETEGNPLFMVEVVRMLATEAPGEEGAWTIRIPQSVREVIARRLGRLSEGCLRVLTAAAVYGRDFAVAALEPLIEAPRDEVLRAIDEATAAGVIEEVPKSPGRLRFSHILLRESMYERLAPSQRLAMHRRAGETLERLHSDELEPHVTELAHHFFEAATDGDAMPAVRYARLAGERALALLAHEEAARLFEMALRAAELEQAIPGREALRAGLLLALGDARARSGDKAAARASFRRAADLAKRLGDADLLARAALGYGGRFVWEAGRDDPALPALLQEALEALPSADGELRVRVMARLAGGPWRDDPDRKPRERMSREAVEIARRVADPSTLGWALDGRYAAVWWPDNLEERIPIARELIDVAREARDLERELQAHHYLCLALMERGEMDGARAELGEQARIAERLRQPAQRLYVTTVEAMMALFEARFDEAEQLILRAHEAGSGAERAMAEIYRAMQRTVLRAEQGRGGEELERLREVAAAFPSYVVLRCVLAWSLARLGRDEEARGVIRSLSTDSFAAIPRNDEWVFALSMLAEAVARIGASDAAEDLHELLLPFVERVAVSAPEVASGAVARPVGLLAALLERWDEADAALRRAQEVNERCGARGWAAWSRLDRGNVLVRRGRPEDRPEALSLMRSALLAAQTIGLRALEEEATAALRGLGEELAEEAPRLTRTFMFTDIEGSTTLLEAIGDDGWQRLRAWHDGTLRALFDAHGGEEVDHMGDGFFVGFADPVKAIRCAIEIQRTLDAHRAAHGFAPQVRIGLHTAEASLTPDGYAGKGVHQAARIGSLAAGGEIVVSHDTLWAAQDVGREGDDRTVELRGIAGPVRVRTVDWRRGP